MKDETVREIGAFCCAETAIGPILGHSIVYPDNIEPEAVA